MTTYVANRAIMQQDLGMDGFRKGDHIRILKVDKAGNAEITNNVKDRTRVTVNPAALEPLIIEREYGSPDPEDEFFTLLPVKAYMTIRRPILIMTEDSGVVLIRTNRTFDLNGFVYGRTTYVDLWYLMQRPKFKDEQIMVPTVIGKVAVPK